MRADEEREGGEEKSKKDNGMMARFSLEGGEQQK